MIFLEVQTKHFLHLFHENKNAYALLKEMVTLWMIKQQNCTALVLPSAEFSDLHASKEGFFFRKLNSLHEVQVAATQNTLALFW